MSGAVWLQRLLGAPAGEPLLREVAAGGARFRKLVFTHNRRVMVSVGESGTALRLHESFRGAPPEVLRAVGVLLARGPSRDREAARELVRAFVRGTARARPVPARRSRAADRAQLERLQEEFDRVNAEHFDGALPRVPLSLSGRMRRRNGHFSSHPVEIVLSRKLCVEGAEGEAEKTLRHEMIHLWQFHHGHRPGHGSDFRRWAERLGIHPRATREVEWKGC